MAYDDQNIFAKILRGEAPAHVLDEDEHTLTFLDIMPIRDGHTLVIPKEPAVDMFDISPDSLGHVMKQVHKMAGVLDRAFNPDGVMIAQLNRAGAGQSVFHLHVHLLPSWGGLIESLHSRGVAPQEKLAEHARLIKAELAKLT